MEALERRKLAVITGIVANTNMDGEDEKKSKLLEDLEETYRLEAGRILGTEKTDEELAAEGEFAPFDMDNPFFRKAYEGMPKVPDGYVYIPEDVEFDQDGREELMKKAALDQI